MIKKIFLYITLTFTLIFLTSCYYQSKSDDESIVISNIPQKTVIFVEGQNGYTNQLRFIVKMRNEDKIYLKEGKIYNDQFVYRTIIEDRDFVVLSCYDKRIYTKNDEGMQEIKYIDDESKKKNQVSDLLINYKTNKMYEVIKSLNELTYIEKDSDNSKNSYTLGIQENAIEAFANISKENGNDFISSKIRLYVYTKDNQLWLRLIDDNTNDIKILDLKDEIKKVIITPSGEYIYALLNNNKIISYNIKTSEIKEILFNNLITTFNLYEEYIYIIYNSTLMVLDGNLKTINEDVIASSNHMILGSTWYKDNSVSNIKYAVLDNEDLIIETIIPNINE